MSRLGYTEASVSLARLVHLGRLAAADLPRHLGSLDDYWDRSIQVVGLTEAVLDEACQLAQRFPLRTYDARPLRRLGSRFRAADSQTIRSRIRAWARSITQTAAAIRRTSEARTAAVEAEVRSPRLP